MLWKAELLYPLPEHPETSTQALALALTRAYTSTTRLSLGLAQAVNDIVSFGDEAGREKVTT